MTQRFAKPLFSMCSTGFGIDFCFFTALLQGFIDYIFNHELIAVGKQFVGENINFEQVFESQTQELNIKPGPGVHRYEQVVVSHNNPFGGPYSYDSQEMLAGHRNILYVFGHVSHETMTRNDRKESGCTFLDIDTSPKTVTVIALDDYLKN